MKKMILLGYRHPSVKLYKPKINRRRQGILLAIVLGDFILPSLGLLMLVPKLIMKVNPLFLYN